ncbi:MAG TPA: PrsW family glutamic-type intramembrane protease [Bryobacteraceae bacterium]|nr:PrsW family glutamic-type intramembrane protease [Bryobacteraceae bacterium]
MTFDVLSAPYLIRLAICILPVLAFLGGLVLLDSFKLAPMRRLIPSLAGGAAVALVAYLANTLLLGGHGVPHTTWIETPLMEELLKALVVWLLLRTGRIGFMVEGAIYGFAVGAGFAMAENIVYLHYLGPASLIIWLVRGFGTSLMHGGGTAIAGILGASQVHRGKLAREIALVGGWALASVLHILYNSPLLPPAFAAGLVLVGIPALMVAIFMRSERAVEGWLGEGFDSDMQLLADISSGDFSQTPSGVYLRSLRDSFAPPLVADMLCLLQISTELAIRAKAELLKREAGFSSGQDEDVKARLLELLYLEKNIGPTGRLALAPLLAGRERRLWELRQLGYSSI